MWLGKQKEGQCGIYSVIAKLETVVSILSYILNMGFGIICRALGLNVIVVM